MVMQYSKAWNNSWEEFISECAGQPSKSNHNAWNVNVMMSIDDRNKNYSKWLSRTCIPK